jgi:hypothetical protein
VFLFSSTIYLFLFKHSINARITDPYVLSLFDRSTNNMVLRTLTAAPRCLRPAAARACPAQISSLLASLTYVRTYVLRTNESVSQGSHFFREVTKEKR